MNGTERRRADQLELLLRSGEIAWWGFEALRLRIARRTFYTPDFVVVEADGELVVEEIKGGHWEDDARVKIKAAAQLFPWIRFRALQARGGETWKVEEVEPF